MTRLELTEWHLLDLQIVVVYWTAIGSNPGGANFAGGGLGTSGSQDSPANVNVHGKCVTFIISL